MVEGVEMKERNEILFHFFAAYFHQDWNLDAPNWQGVVNCFVRDEGSERARHVRDEVNKLLNKVESDVQLAQVLGELGCYYWAGSPSQMRDWLETVSTKLQVD